MSFGRVEDIIYYTTEKGLVAVSLDEGETIVLPTGKRMPPTEAWEETSEDLESRLTDAQKRALRVALGKPEMSEVGALAWKHRKRVIHDNRAYVQHEAPRREVRESALVVSSDFED